MAHKFIINGKLFLYGNVDLHEELKEEHEETRGGGYFYINPITKNMYLYGSSVDFGQARKEDIINAFKENGLPAELSKSRIYHTYNDKILNMEMEDGLWECIWS